MYKIRYAIHTYIYITYKNFQKERNDIITSKEKIYYYTYLSINLLIYYILINSSTLKILTCYL